MSPSRVGTGGGFHVHFLKQIFYLNLITQTHQYQKVMNHFHYNKKLRNFASSQRKNMTKSEACLWKYVLMGRQMKGYQFRRQRPISNYIADFVCLPLKLIVEVDGFTHENQEALHRDITRDDELKKLGFTTLRFSSWEVLNQIADVSTIIADWIDKNAEVPPPGPRQRGKSRK